MSSGATVFTFVALLFAAAVAAQEAASPPPSAAGESAKLLDIKQRYPAYPRESIAAEETGLTRLRMHIAASGELRGVSLVQSSGSARLDEASIAAVRRCQFKRPRATSQPKFKVEYNWRLEEGGVPAAPLGPEKPDRLRPPL